MITWLYMSPSGDRECLPEACCSGFKAYIQRPIDQKIKAPRTTQKRNINLCTINQDNVYQPEGKVRWDLTQVGSKASEMGDLCVHGMGQKDSKRGKSLCCLLESCWLGQADSYFHR